MLLGVLSIHQSVQAMFCTLLMKEEAWQDQEADQIPGQLSHDDFPTDLIILVSSNLIEIKNFDDQWFFEKKQRLDGLLSLAQTNKSLRYKILKFALPELIYTQDQAHALFPSNLQYPFKHLLTEMGPERLLKIFVEVFDYNTYGVGTRIGIFLVSLIMPHDG